MKNIILSFIYIFISSSIFAQTTATYNITFTSEWNGTDHANGVNFPGGAHWSNLIGANHNNSIAFLEMTGMAMASPGVEDVAEIGNPNVFKSEITSHIGVNAQQIIEQSVPFGASGSVTKSNVEINQQYPLLTFISMIAPSPDWIVGVSNLNLRNATNDGWQSLIEVDLFVYDAGTENGGTYSTNNSATNPQQNITSLNNIAPFNNQRVGYFTISLVEVLSVDEKVAFKNVSVFPNPTKGNITISNTLDADLKNIEVYNILGSLVQSININSTINTTQVDLSNLSKGIYILKLQSKNGTAKTQKLVIE